MKIEQLGVGALGTNCYFIINEETKDTLCVDPGGNGLALAKRAESEGYKISAILLTHGHYDHVDGVEDLKNNLSYPVKVYALDKEEEVLNDPDFNLSGSFATAGKTYHCDEVFTDGQKVTLGGLTFNVIATPGHTKGGCCFYFEDESTLFCGDTLFESSIGRTDFPGGSMDVLEKSIREKLYVLPEDTKVYPGHMGITTIGREKRTNMFVKA